MKRSIQIRVMNRYLPLFGRLALVVQCLGMESSAPTIGGIWTKAIDGTGSERFDANKLFHGLIVSDLNRPEPNRYKRSGELRQLAMLPM